MPAQQVVTVSALFSFCSSGIPLEYMWKKLTPSTNLNPISVPCFR
ncbi:hypothetical protein ERHA55_53480 (plasmid) [Erwinia rhapontici]|nr:hypothetical protein ERHA55_53480 [Erwinia rhapontici]